MRNRALAGIVALALVAALAVALLSRRSDGDARPRVAG